MLYEEFLHVLGVRKKQPIVLQMWVFSLRKPSSVAPAMVRYIPTNIGLFDVHSNVVEISSGIMTIEILHKKLFKLLTEIFKSTVQYLLGSLSCFNNYCILYI